MPVVDDRVRRLPAAVSIDVDRPGVGSDLSLVADLAAALGVERRTVEEQPNPLALLRRLELGVVLVQEEAHRRFRLVFSVADELGRRDRSGLQTDLDLLGGRARTVALLLEQAREPVGIDRQPLVGRELLGELDREPERVVTT